MQRVTVNCPSAPDLRRLWSQRFSQGTFFLPTQFPYALYAEFELFIRTRTPESGIVFRARVMQILEGPTADAQGMVCEILRQADDAELIEAALTGLEKGTLVGTLDFESYRSNRQASRSLILEPLGPQPSIPGLKAAGQTMPEKARTLFEAAVLLADAREHGASLANLRLALRFEPENARYAQKLRDVERMMRGNQPASEQRERAAIRGKSTDGWLG